MESCLEVLTIVIQLARAEMSAPLLLSEGFIIIFKYSCVIPSCPPAEPLGNDLIAPIISSSNTVIFCAVALQSFEEVLCLDGEKNVSAVVCFEQAVLHH